MTTTTAGGPAGCGRHAAGTCTGYGTGCSPRRAPESKPAAGIRVGDRTALGYVAAVTDAMSQQRDGRVITAPGCLTLYFRSKPFSPRGLIRGCDRGTLTLGAGDHVALAG